MDLKIHPVPVVVTLIATAAAVVVGITTKYSDYSLIARQNELSQARRHYRVDLHMLPVLVYYSRGGWVDCSGNPLEPPLLEAGLVPTDDYCEYAP